MLTRLLSTISIDTAGLADLAGKEGLMLAKTVAVSLLILLVGWIIARLLAADVSPLNNAIDKVVGALPSVAVAAVIAIVGWILGRIVRSVVRNLLDAVGLDTLTERLKIRAVFGERSPSDVAGVIAMAFVVLQAAIAALGQLGLATLANPLTDMVGQFWTLLPGLLVSALIVAVGVLVGRLVGGLAARLLGNVGFGRLLARIGFEEVLERDDALGKPSQLVGTVLRVGIILVAISQALANLELAL